MSEYIFGEETLASDNFVMEPLFATREGDSIQGKSFSCLFSVKDGIARPATEEDRAARNVHGLLAFFAGADLYMEKGSANIGTIGTKISTGQTVGPNNRIHWMLGTWLLIIPITIAGITRYVPFWGEVGEKTTVDPLTGLLSFTANPPSGSTDVGRAVAAMVQSMIPLTLGHAPDGVSVSMSMEGHAGVIDAVRDLARKTRDLDAFSGFHSTLRGEVGGQVVRMGATTPRVRFDLHGKEFTRVRRDQGQAKPRPGAAAKTEVAVQDALDDLMSI